MHICWKCKYEHQDDVRVCRQCGAIDSTTIAVEPTINAMRAAGLSPSNKRTPDGSLSFISQISLKIGNETLVIPVDKRVLFGRGIRSRDDFVAIDLTRFNAVEMGVSRHHADLRRLGGNRLVLMDLDSTNGTRLNDKPLEPQKAYTLKHDDHVFFGNLDLTVQFAGVSASQS